MVDVTFDIDGLKDRVVMKEPLILEGMLDSMRVRASEGHPIIIEQRYSNAPPDLLARLSSLKEVNDWIKANFPGFDKQEESD